MDGIQKFHDATSRVPAHASHSHAVNPTIVKSTSDYMRALRRRIWLVLAVAIPLSVGAAVYTMRMPAVFQSAMLVRVSLEERRLLPRRFGIGVRHPFQQARHQLVELPCGSFIHWLIQIVGRRVISLRVPLAKHLFFR